MRFLAGILVAALLLATAPTPAAADFRDGLEWVYEAHGNEELLALQAAEGWPGTGTVQDPIRIEGLNISVSKNQIIRLVDVDLHVLFTNNTLQVANTRHSVGAITLQATRNVDIVDNRFPGPGAAVYSLGTWNTLVSRNQFDSPTRSWDSQFDVSPTFAYNNVSGPSYIGLSWSVGPRAEHNLAENAVLAVGPNRGEGGHIAENRVRGLAAVGSSMAIQRNIIGLYLEGEDLQGSAIENNVILEGYSTGCSMSFGADTIENVIANNTVAGDYCGISFGARSTGNLVYNNRFDGGYGWRVPPNPGGAVAGIERGLLFMNKFHVDPTPGTNIVGGDTIGGNYWGPDFPTPDDDGDGFGDIPYPSLRPDEYPLVLPEEMAS